MSHPIGPHYGMVKIFGFWACGMDEPSYWPTLRYG